MTAVVGILNKQAVAIAADSAVTISGSNGRKIFNKANKVFTLSKYHPIGVMIYNSASFMETPWETIIKMYRRQLGDRSFATVDGYQQDFIAFLRDRQFYTTPEVQVAYLEDFSLSIIDSLTRMVAQVNRGLIDAPSEDTRKEFIRILEAKIDGLLQQDRFAADKECCEDFANYSFESFVTYSRPVIDSIVQNRFTPNGIHVSDDLRVKITHLIFSILREKEKYYSYTGLIFTGFGENEIYPQLIPVNISMVIDNRLRYYIDQGRAAEISNNNGGSVCPFAQTDVI